MVCRVAIEDFDRDRGVEAGVSMGGTKDAGVNAVSDFGRRFVAALEAKVAKV